jgi:enoyl-CoA hydratase
MSAELISDTCEAFNQVGADNDTWVVILTGAGRAFSSGLDLEDHGLVPGIEGLTLPRIAMRSVEHFAQVVPALRAVPQPVIAAVNGAAYGGGFCLTLGADIRIAEESVVINATGIVNGLTSTELGASYLLPRLIGASQAFDILLTGRTVDAAEAKEMGLVSRVVPTGEAMNTAMDIAEKMCKLSPYGLFMTKQTLWANLEVPGLQAAIDLENRNQLLLGFTNNLPEAISARKEKRQPVYEDIPRIYD